MDENKVRSEVPFFSSLFRGDFVEHFTMEFARAYPLITGLGW